MRKIRRAEIWLWLAGLGAVALGLWLLSRPLPERAPGPGQRTAPQSTLPPPPDLRFPTGRQLATSAVVPELPAAVEPAGALRGHRVWSAGSGEELAALAERARAAGLTVHGAIPQLGLLHVSGRDDLLRRLAPEGAEEEYVFPIGLSPYPEEVPFALDGLVPFEAATLRYLGVEAVPPEWGSGVRVAILDTGVSAHQALEGARIVQTGAGSGDGNGHGTAMASLLAGRGELARGLAPAASVLSVPVLDDSGWGDSFDLAQGIVTAVNAGARLLSISAGSSQPSAALEQAVRYAQSAGAVILAATGNEGPAAVRYPAAIDGVVGVTAVDAASQRPAFASYGSVVDVAAPGVGIYSSWLDDSFVSMSGSSPAVPLVAGAIAAVMSAEPGLSAAQATELVLEYANEGGAAGRDPAFGAGILNLERVLQRETPGIVDLGVVPPYLDLPAAQDASVPLYLGVQNRGTEPLSGARLDLEIGGIAYSYAVGTLQAGESRSVQLPIALGQLEGTAGLEIRMEGSHAGGSEPDARPENDLIEAILKIGTPAATGEDGSAATPGG